MANPWVIGKDLSNPIPGWAEHGAERKAVPYTVATDMDSPNPDSVRSISMLAAHFVPFAEFETDAAAGPLPDFSLIEPNMLSGHGDYHPAFGRSFFGHRRPDDGQPVLHAVG